MSLLGKQKISYLIIGNGIAGVTAAEMLRAEDPQAAIGVIADDPYPVYYRPALKDYLGGHIPTEKLRARPDDFYRDANIAFLPDRVIGLDSEHHAVLLQSQKQVRYQKLLLANGASPARLNCPGNDLRGVTTLRTVADYQNILERLEGGVGAKPGSTASTRPVRRVVVSGSGTLALETAESLRQRGLEVTHLLRRTTLWSEVLDTTASDLVLQEERRAGVEVCLEEEIVKIAGRGGEVSSVMTNRRRRIACQMVIVAIGIEPNIRPWKISGVTCGRGVQVDNALRTNLPDVYAAGDLIEIRDRLTNRTRVLGQWYPAIQQARIATSSMLGRTEEVERLRTETRLLSTYNATSLYGLDFASAGLTVMPDQSRGYQELVADPQPRSYRKVILKDGIPVGLLALGDRKQALALKRAIDHRINLLPIAGRLFTPDFNLRAWLDEQGVPPPILTVGGGQAPTPPLQAPLQEEQTQRLVISDEQTGEEETMADNRQTRGTTPRDWAQRAGGQAQGTAPTDYEALLVPIVDPVLRLDIAETSLSQVGGGQGQDHPIRIGRQAGVHLLLDEGSVSRQHAEISQRDGQYVIRDLGSTNGTFVNEQRLDASRPYVLQPNDVLRIGNIVRLKFLLRPSSRIIDRRDSVVRLPDPSRPSDSSFLTEDAPRVPNNRRVTTSLLSDPSRPSDPSLLSEDAPRVPNNRRVTTSLLSDPSQPSDPSFLNEDAPRVPNSRRVTTSLLSDNQYVGQIPTAKLKAADKPDLYQEQYTTGPVQTNIYLNPDGTLSTPGNGNPVPASIVEQLKKAPALVIVPEGSAQNGIPPQIHFLKPGQRTTIGREEDNDIILTDLTVSRHHAEVFLNVSDGNSSCYIRDLGSTYGTLVNQTKISTRHLLSHSDRIKLGSTRIFFIDLQAGKELTAKSAGVKMGTRVTQKSNTVPQTNVVVCPNCGIANARVARFCASCSTGLGQAQIPLARPAPTTKEY